MFFPILPKNVACAGSWLPLDEGRSVRHEPDLLVPVEVDISACLKMFSLGCVVARASVSQSFSRAIGSQRPTRTPLSGQSHVTIPAGLIGCCPTGQVSTLGLGRDDGRRHRSRSGKVHGCSASDRTIDTPASLPPHRPQFVFLSAQDLHDRPARFSQDCSWDSQGNAASCS